MKYIKINLCISISLICFCNLAAQVNLVSNPSFENYSTCPSGPDELYKVIGWSSYRYTPDYYNVCGVSSVSVPYNWAGYQQASTGLAYTGFATYYNATSLSNYREYLGTQLTSTLSVGVKYFVSFKVCMSMCNVIQSNCASDKMGAMFSKVPFSVSNPAPITNNAKVYSNTIITDSVNWTRIFGSFISDSLYKYLIIGNFFNNTNTDTLIMNTDNTCSSYYYLDDVCVSTDSLFTLQYIPTVIFERPFNSSFLLYPNPISNVLYIENKLFDKSYDLKISNILGQELYHKENIETKTFSLDAINFEGGVLILNITNNTNHFIYKLIKQ